MSDRVRSIELPDAPNKPTAIAPYRVHIDSCGCHGTYRPIERCGPMERWPAKEPRFWIADFIVPDCEPLKRARERTALRKLRHATQNHVRGLLFSIYRSAVKARPVPIPVYPLRLQVARTDVFDAAKGNRPTWPYAHVEGCRSSVRGMQRWAYAPVSMLLSSSNKCH